MAIFPHTVGYPQSKFPNRLLNSTKSLFSVLGIESNSYGHRSRDRSRSQERHHHPGAGRRSYSRDREYRDYREQRDHHYRERSRSRERDYRREDKYYDDRYKHHEEHRGERSSRDEQTPVPVKATNEMDATKKILCKICQKQFYNKCTLRQHFENKHKRSIVICKICNTILNSKSEESLHRIKFHKCIFKCEYCEGTFRAKSSLNVHIKTRHVETRTFNKSCQTDFSEEYGNEVGFDESFRLNLSDEVKILGVLLKNFKWL